MRFFADPLRVLRYFMGPEMNLERRAIPASKGLSDIDKACMVLFYGHPTPHSSAPTWTLEHALKVIHTDEETNKKILDSKGNAAQIRQAYMTYLAKTGGEPAPKPLLPTAPLDYSISKMCAIVVPAIKHHAADPLRSVGDSVSNAVVSQLVQLWESDAVGSSCSCEATI
jgi:hypothetical protein